VNTLSGKRGGYRRSVVGLPFAPEGVVLNKDGRTVVWLDYELQDEKLFVRRLASIARTLEAIDKKGRP
jgi:hypothetical protein